MLALVPLSDEQNASRYLNEHFGTYSRIHSNINSTTKFSCSALVPQEVTVERASIFEMGGICTIDESTTWLIDRTRRKSLRGDKICLICEDLYFQPSDYLVKENSPFDLIKCAHSTIFVPLPATSLSSADILRRYLRLASSADFVIGVVDERVGFQKMIETGDGIEELYFSCFDGESFIVLHT